MEYMGKTADGFMVFPYGLFANVPKDTLALMLAIQGNPDNRAAIACSVDNRPDLEEGETAFYHPLIPGLLIKLKADGKMSIESAVKIDIIAPETEFTGIVKANGKIIDDTHGHAQANDSGGNTEVNISGVL